MVQSLEAAGGLMYFVRRDERLCWNCKCVFGIEAVDDEKGSTGSLSRNIRLEGLMFLHKLLLTLILTISKPHNIWTWELGQNYELYRNLYVRFWTWELSQSLYLRQPRPGNLRQCVSSFKFWTWELHVNLKLGTLSKLGSESFREI